MTLHDGEGISLLASVEAKTVRLILDGHYM